MTWAISVPIFVFLGLSVLQLGPMYATDRRQTKTSLEYPIWFKTVSMVFFLHATQVTTAKSLSYRTV